MLTWRTPALWLSTLMMALYLAPAALAQPQQVPDADIKQFKDWEVRCPKGGSSADNRCTMSQLINNPSNDQPMLRTVVAYPPRGNDPVMVFLMPLGVRLAPGLQLQVDNGQPIPFPFQVCVDQGCRADLPLEAELLNQLRSGTKATLSLIGPNGERLDPDISLLGFTDASRAIMP